MAPREDLLFGGVANKFTCLASNSNGLSKECFFSEVDASLDAMVEGKGNKCKDELRSKCGKQIDALKKAIEHTSVIGTVKGAVDVVECIVNNAEDLWNHCKPGKSAAAEEVSPAIVTVIDESSCESRALELCPATQNKVLGLGFTLGCLVDKASVLGSECAHERIVVAMDELENSSDKPCHDELRKKCGKQIDNLKKEIQETSVLGTLKAAVDVVQCVAQNAEDLWNKCKPFEGEALAAQAVLDEEEVEDAHLASISFVAGAPTPPTRKPTHKPTHKPTKRPTPKPTVRPTSKPTKSVSPTTSKPTAKPTPRKIAEQLMLFHAPANNHHQPEKEERPEMMMNTRGGMHHSHQPEYFKKMVVEEEEEVAIMPAELPPMMNNNIVPSVEIVDMDECVRSARRFCAAEVFEFNASPFDSKVLEALNACIDRNAAIIVADCTIAPRPDMDIFDGPRPPHHHGHRCRKFWKHIAAGVFMLFLTIFLARKCYVRRMKAKLANQGEIIQAEPQYQPLVEAKGPTMV